MIFANRDIKTFWYAKAVKFDTSYYADFSRQEVTSRGLLRSYIEVPTVRKIVVSILVRVKGKQSIDERVREITHWLISSGESRLMSERDQSRYYIARCTSVSIPKFNGMSATFNATFTCSDYRPYDAFTNKPIGDASTDLSNFTFNGKHCLNDLKCLFVCDNMQTIPSVSRNAYTIAGMSGTLRYDDGLAPLEEKMMQGTLHFLKGAGSTELMTQREIMERAHEVTSWLINAKRAPLILDSDSFRMYQAEVIDEGELSFDKWANGALKVKFTLQPHCTDIKARESNTTAQLASGQWSTVSLSDIAIIGYTTPLEITITNNSSSTITDLRVAYYNEDNVEKSIRLYEGGFALSRGASVTINSTSNDVLIGGISSLKCVKSGDFPVITPCGNKSIKIYANASASVSVAVKFNARWL